MKPLTKAICLLLVSQGLSLGALAAELQFGPAFTSGMVLQRETPIHITGEGPAGREITVSLGAQQQTAKIDAAGQWQVIFDPMFAGGAYRLQVTAGNTQVTLEDVLIGDVWLFSGQSNMQLGLGEALGGSAALAAAQSNAPVRLLSVPKAGAATPQENLGAAWVHCSPKALRRFSAVAWFCATRLRQDSALTNIPLGLIDSSFGGSAIEAWMPVETLPHLPENQRSASMFGIPPGQLYNQMIFPLRAYRIKGVCWYQGEANAGHPADYAQLLQNLIAQWRRQWQQPDLPFFIVQLPAYAGRVDGLDFSWLREAQAQACRETSRTWLAVTFDTTAGFDLHPSEKQEISRRLALLIRQEVYGEDLPAHGPGLESVKTEADAVRVTFDQPVTVPPGETPVGFELAGADGEYYYAHAEITGCQGLLRAASVPAPETVRYAWGPQPRANLTSLISLPATPFRTDHQTPDTLVFQPLPEL
ncbi:MAG TPA: sialate O-acetylesterase [Dongiaceae bacterium]|nr:sialate O-acetylesterase [Dongiaceae bacterium]